LPAFRSRPGLRRALSLCLFLGLLGAAAALVGTGSRLAARSQIDSALAEQLDGLFSGVAGAVKGAVVAIGTHEEAAAGPFPTGDLPLGEALGSGFVIDPRGYILTNHHLVGGGRAICVRLSDGRDFAAALVQSDAASDIALLKIEAGNLPVARLGDSEELRVGQWVVAIGNPYGLLQTVSAGIISALKRSDLRLLPYENFIQTDASINPGNSGGPLVSLRGEVVGINTAVYSAPGRGSHGIGFAVPINLARALAERWMEGKTVSFLGIVPGRVDADMARYFGLETPQGAFVKQVDAGGPAASGGMRPMDLILEFAGEEVRDENHLRLLIARRQPREEIEVRVRRGKSERLLRIHLEQRDGPPPPELPRSAKEENRTRLLGITVTTLSESMRWQLGLPPESRGMAIIQVDPQSAAWRKGLERGDVIREVNEVEVNSTDELRAALELSGDAVALRVFRGGAELGYFFLSR
jgi:serine protease Do